MAKDKAHDYRGFDIAQCNGPECAHWRLTFWDTPDGECAGQSKGHCFYTQREAHDYIDKIHEDGEREGWRIEREAMEEFDCALYLSKDRDYALRESGDMHGFDTEQMSILLEERARPGARPRRSKPMWYPLASAPAEPFGKVT